MLIVLALGNNVNGVIVVPKGDDLNSSKSMVLAQQVVHCLIKFFSTTQKSAPVVSLVTFSFRENSEH